jgi:hypothetical protein
VTVPGTRQAGQLPAGVNAILTSGLVRGCYYAGTRSDCQLLASVRHGQIALCARCDQRRSTVGKGAPRTQLPDPSALHQIAVARETCQQAAAALCQAVAHARHAGQPWSAIAAVLGVSRQAAQQRFAEGTQLR